MRNATAEITEFVRDRGVVLAAQVSFKPNSQVEVDYQYRLGDNWEAFCESLDLDYDAGFGTQQLFGTIWFQDGSWGTRREYDGAEWWQHHMRPQIPENLLR
jgi:hypothetical protein